ncbi:hypothetical protein Vadar_002953 [Vaccinium darrowii]|uniref:Uncharacterized protein n=1 Tax=Vaccinium darrowii TaxID=229202 RepID=A0ACB7X753_9ERIC|nr:hypothetical protein Vadar_002953 [Vaccinium darrowii]
MEAQCLLSGFCSNSINSPIQNPTKHSFPILPSYCSSSLSSERVSFKTIFPLASKFESPRYKSQRKNCLRKVEAVSGDGQDLKGGVRRKNLAVFVSGGGSNFRSIHQAILKGSVQGEIVVLVTNKPGCGGADYARDNNIPVILFSNMKEKPDSLSADDLVTRNLEIYGSMNLSILRSSSWTEICYAEIWRYKVDFILLAGYLKLIPLELVRAYSRSILNIHPSLLPAFGGKGYYGMKVYQAVIAFGARSNNSFVDEHYDTGHILAQRVVPVLANDTANELAARVLQQVFDLLTGTWCFKSFFAFRVIFW